MSALLGSPQQGRRAHAAWSTGSHVVRPRSEGCRHFTGCPCPNGVPLSRRSRDVRPAGRMEICCCHTQGGSAHQLQRTATDTKRIKKEKKKIEEKGTRKDDTQPVLHALRERKQGPQGDACPPNSSFYRPAVASERACMVAALPLLAARRTAPYFSVMNRKKSRHTSSKKVVVLATAAPAAALERRSA